jgi:hypothetical protein
MGKLDFALFDMSGNADELSELVKLFFKDIPLLLGNSRCGAIHW